MFRWPLTWSRSRPLAWNFANCALISSRNCARHRALVKYRRPLATGLLENCFWALTRAGICAADKVELPQTRVKCSPTPSFGFWRAKAIASSAAGSLTIKLVVVRMPSRWARMTASLIERERPKSSALTIRRRTASRGSIVGHSGAGNQLAPGAEDEQDFLAFVQAGRARTKNLEAAALKLAEKPPIDRTHQLRRRHGTAVLSRQGLAGQAVKFAGLLRHVFGQLRKALRVL